MQSNGRAFQRPITPVPKSEEKRPGGDPFEIAAYSLIALNEREISPPSRRAAVSWRSACPDALFRLHRVSFADPPSALAEFAIVCCSSLYAFSASPPDEWRRFAV